MEKIELEVSRHVYNALVNKKINVLVLLLQPELLQSVIIKTRHDTPPNVDGFDVINMYIDTIGIIEDGFEVGLEFINGSTSF